MSSFSGGYGLIPINKLGGRVEAGAVRQLPIASAYAANIFTGDIVKMVADGTIEKDTGTTTATPVGVFMGCQYTDPNLGYLVHKQYWPTGTVASDAVAFVADDPQQLFRIKCDGSVASTALGNNIAIVQGSGSTTTGVSGVTGDASTAADTATLPLRVIDLYDDPDNAWGDSYTELVVKWNAGDHQYEVATGAGIS